MTGTIILKDTLEVEDYTIPEQGKLKNFEVKKLKEGQNKVIIKN